MYGEEMHDPLKHICIHNQNLSLYKYIYTTEIQLHVYTIRTQYTYHQNVLLYNLQAFRYHLYTRIAFIHH